MNKKVLIVSSSPRTGGNSDALCDEFLKGARSAGHTAEKICLKDYSINYCTGCGYCINHQGHCSQKDDMHNLSEKMRAADVIVFATPVYFYTMCGQLKTFIDRTCFFYTELKNKELYFIMTAAEDATSAMDKTIAEFTGYLDCLSGAQTKGMILATGVWNSGDVQRTTYLKNAFEMGTTV